jgi:Glycosyltransferase family 87
VNGSKEQGTKDAAKPVPPYYVKGLALGVTAYLIGIHLWTWVFWLPTFLGGRADFRQLYTAGYMVRIGHARQLYDLDAQLHFQRLVVGPGDVPLPFIRPAFEALLFAPFSFLHYRAAYFTFLIINVALLAICFRLLRARLDNLAEVHPWLPIAMFLGFLPLAAALMQGQDSILLLTLLTVALTLLDRGRDFVAGLLIGLGLFKLQIVLPLGLLFLVWRRWRFSAGFVITAAAMAFLSIWVAGSWQAQAYARSLLSVSAGIGSLENQFSYPVPVAQMANLHGLIFGLAHTRMSGFFVQAATISTSALVFVVSAVLARGRQSSDNLLVAISISAVVSYYLLIHDLSVLFLPVAITLNRYLPAEATGDNNGRRLARTAALMFVAPMCFSYVPDHFYVVAVPALALLFTLVDATRLEEGGMWNWHKQRMAAPHA